MLGKDHIKRLETQARQKGSKRHEKIFLNQKTVCKALVVTHYNERATSALTIGLFQASAMVLAVINYVAHLSDLSVLEQLSWPCMI